MKEHVIRSQDEALINALTLWFEDFKFRLSGDGTLVFTDLDSFEQAGLPGEITLSRQKPCHLPRPFSFEELECLVGNTALSKKRLIFTEQGAFLDGTKLSLSSLEQRLLFLLSKAEEPVSAKDLSIALWGEERNSNQVNVYIRYLRKKTDLEGKERLIFTLHGKGFYLKNDN